MDFMCYSAHSQRCKKHSDSDHRKQVSNFIKTLCFGASEEEMDVTQDIFWTEYTDFDNNIGSFDADEFILKSKDIRDGNSHLWHQKYSLPWNKVLGFFSCRVTSKVLGIGTAESSSGDVKKIKYRKISSIISDVSEKQSIVYKSPYIE